MAKQGELGIEMTNGARVVDSEKAALSDQDAADLANVGKRQQLGVSKQWYLSGNLSGLMLYRGDSGSGQCWALRQR